MADRIKFGTPREDTLLQRSMPIELFHSQSVARDSFVVLLDRAAWEQICTHANRHTDRSHPGRSVECAGLLAGQAYHDAQRQVTFVAIREAIETNAEHQSAGSVRISAHDYGLARQIIDTKGLRVVGWYHTHPGYGIFLSPDDQRVVQSLFNASWHVALVYDPIRNLVGCFRGPTCLRVDDDDHPRDFKQNYAIVDDWQGFWNQSEGSSIAQISPSAPEQPSRMMAMDDIVPDSLDQHQTDYEP
jgi:proteasome lid subunit RPN8/RPN11